MTGFDGTRMAFTLGFLVACVSAAAQPVRLHFSGSGSLHLAWVREGGVELANVALPGQIELGAGNGCLVVARTGQPVRWRELALPEESGSASKLLDRAAGALLFGVVRTRDIWAFPPSVEVTPLDRVIPDLCRRGLDELEAWRGQVDSHGGVELGPLPAGKWSFSSRAPMHKGFTREITIATAARPVELGTVELQPLAVVGVRIESDWEDPPFTLEVEKGERASDQEPWQFRALKRIDLVGKEADIELDPGTHRFKLAKPGTQLGLAIDAELQAGEQELILRPVPFTVDGRVLRGDRGVAGVRLEVARGGDPLVLMTGSTGGFSIPLWATGMYLVEVQPPDGTPEAILLDARDGKAGESLDRDIVLAKHRLSGVVVGAPAGAPIAVAEVVIKQEGGGKLFASTYKTGDDGAFSAYIRGGMRVDVSASARGYLPQTVVLGEELPSSPLVVSLERGLAVTGRVVAPDGSALQGAWVLGAPGSPVGETTCSAQTGANGVFDITCPAGTVLFGVAGGYSLGWTPAREGEVLVYIGPPQPATQVEIQTSNGQPAEGAAITFQTQDGLWVPFPIMSRALAMAGRGARAGSDGVLSVPVLPPGTYTAHLVMRTGTMTLGVVILPATSPLSFKLPPRPPS